MGLNRRAAIGTYCLFPGRRRNVDPASEMLLELFELERSVVEGARETEPEFHERLLARAVPSVHGLELGNGLMGFVDDEKKVFGEVVDERRGGSPALRPDRCRE